MPISLVPPIDFQRKFCSKEHGKLGNIEEGYERYGPWSIHWTSAGSNLSQRIGKNCEEHNKSWKCSNEHHSILKRTTISPRKIGYLILEDTYFLGMTNSRNSLSTIQIMHQNIQCLGNELNKISEMLINSTSEVMQTSISDDTTQTLKIDTSRGIQKLENSTIHMKIRKPHCSWELETGKCLMVYFK